MEGVKSREDTSPLNRISKFRDTEVLRSLGNFLFVDFIKDLGAVLV